MSGTDYVTVKIILDSKNVLRKLHIAGHAGNNTRGSNVACGVVSLLAKTAYEVIRDLKSISVVGEAPEPGGLWFEVGMYEVEYTEQLRGLTSFLVKGFSVVQREYPEAVQMVIQYTGG